MPIVVLWDIDGTLVRSNGGRVSVSAFTRALHLAAGLDGDTASLPYPKEVGGKTDEQIALEMLLGAAYADEVALELLPRFGQLYLDELVRDRDKLMGDLRVLPGVREALARLQRLGAVQSLLTGNLEPIARLKLACVGLADYVDFDLGAYGSDDRDRTCLVPVSRQRLRLRLGVDMSPEDIVVVGDTPRDIACARAGGTRVVAVATGNFSRKDLEVHRPDVVLDDLRDTEQVLTALVGMSPTLQ